MPRTPLLLLLAGLSGCAGTLYAVSKGASSATPDDTYACVQAQLTKQGYTRKSHNPLERWIVGQKTDSAGHLADVRFRRRVSLLDTRIRPDASGNSAIEIRAQSFDQFDNQQGFIETETNASAQVKQDAQAVIGACGK